MSIYFISIFLTVASNLAYHICQKSIRPAAHPLASLLVTYLAGIVLTLTAFKLFYPHLETGAECRKLGWASYVLGISIVGLELGFLLAYRAGWNLSLAALYSNVTVTLVLLPVGILFFKEKVSVVNGVGGLLALLGLVMMGRKS